MTARPAGAADPSQLGDTPELRWIISSAVVSLPDQPASHAPERMFAFCDGVRSTVRAGTPSTRCSDVVRSSADGITRLDSSAAPSVSTCRWALASWRVGFTEANARRDAGEAEVVAR